MFETTLISGDNLAAMWAVCITIAALAFYLEQKVKWCGKLGSAPIAIFGTLLVANIGIIPNASPVFNAINSYLLPLAIPLLLFNCNIKRIVKESGKMIFMFVAAAVGVFCSTLICGMIFRGGNAEAAAGAAAMMTGAHIGGTVNLVAMGNTFNVDPDLLSSITISANLLLIVYLAAQSMICSSKKIRAMYPHPHIDEFEKNTDGTVSASAEYWKAKNISLLGISKSLATAFVILAVSNQFCAIVNASAAPDMIKQLFGSIYLVLTLFTTILATLFPKYFESLEGAEEMGTFMICLFFVGIGGAGNLSTIFASGAMILVFYVCDIIFSLTIPMVVGKFMKWNLEEIMVASNASFGGPTTAPALAISKGWASLAVPGILVGLLGYIIGNYFGVLVYNIII